MMFFVAVFIILLIFLAVNFSLSYKISISNDIIRITNLFKTIQFSRDEIIDAQETIERKKIKLTNWGIMKTYKEIDIIIMNTRKDTFIVKSTDKNYEEIKCFLGVFLLK